MSQNHLGILSDSELAFEEYYKKILSKTNRTIGLLRKLQSLLPSAALSIQLLLDLISTPAMFSMIKHLTLRSMKN